MSWVDVVFAALLGLLQGLTEFIPVSSTGHLIIAADLLNFNDPNGSFKTMIQFGSILAVVVIYFQKLWNVLITLPSDPKSRQFAFGIIIAFLPAAILGVILHDFIKSVLQGGLWPVAISLVVGGIVILFIERNLPKARYTESDNLTLVTAFGVGIVQCLAFVPGVSRSGATIIGGLLMGLERRAAAEFSFFLAVPTMLGAFVYDAYDGWSSFTTDSVTLLAIGFVTAFIAAYVVVRQLLDFVSRHGFAPFAWYRIVLGGLMIAYLVAVQ
jgi:undecaprenyl-diphosphatase